VLPRSHSLQRWSCANLFRLQTERRAAAKAIAVQSNGERVAERRAAIARYTFNAELGRLVVRRAAIPNPT
jgi:hypothetical protein